MSLSKFEVVLGINVFLAPRPYALAPSDAVLSFTIDPVHKIVGYRNRTGIHSLSDLVMSDLNDPFFADGEWLVLWLSEVAGRCQRDWMRHDVCMKCMAPLVERYVMRVYDLTSLSTDGEADACSAMSLSKTPDPPFFAPRSGVLDKPNPSVFHEPMFEIVGYRNRSRIHSLSDLNDPHFVEGEWLVLWKIKGVNRSQTDWLRHDVCMQIMAPLVMRYVMKLYDLKTPRTLSIMVGHFSSIDDVNVQEILYEAKNNMYLVEIASLSESFINEAIHPRFSNNIMQIFAIEYNSNDNAMHVLLPQLLVKHAYPDLVTTFNAEASRRQTLCGHPTCKEKRCWHKETRRTLEYKFVVRDEPDLSEVARYTTIVRPSAPVAQSAARCNLTSATVPTVGTCCCMRRA